MQNAPPWLCLPWLRHAGFSATIIDKPKKNTRNNDLMRTWLISIPNKQVINWVEKKKNRQKIGGK